MKPKNSILFASFVMFSLLVSAFIGGEKVMADTIIYRASLTNNKKRTVAVKKSGANLIILLEGFSDKPLELKANGGGTDTCRTTIEHNSSEITVSLSLGMPDTRARCAMMPSFISIQGNNISIEEETIKKIVGNNSTVRNTVQKILGKIEEGES